MSEKKWHTLPEKDIFQILLSSKEGLSTNQAAKILKDEGFNELTKFARKTPLQIFLEQFKSFLVIILVIAALISFAVGEHLDATAITIIIIINTLLGFFQEYRAEKAIEALEKMTSPKAIVLRDGKKMEIPSREVVPGDILVLDEGKKIPSDARILESNALKVDEAVLTGESLPKEKKAGTITKDVQVSDMNNMLFMGTHVTSGNGRAVVVSTGMDTEFGKIAELVQKTEQEKTPLQKKLEKFGKNIGLLILGVAAIVFLIGIYEGTASLVDMFIIAVVLAIGAMPEGLPAVVTFTLALGMREMAKHNAIVRKLLAVETLGTTTVICSDKTGTLTKNQMTITKIFANNQFIDVTGVGYEPKGGLMLEGKKIEKLDETLEKLAITGTLCNNSQIRKEDSEYIIIGDPTEAALLVLAEKTGNSEDKLKKSYKFVSEQPFTSDRKMMSVAYKKIGTNSYVKGAPEVIIERCSSILINGKTKKLSAEEKKELVKTSRKMAEIPLRLLALAYKPIKSAEKHSLKELETELIFLGIVGMEDPPREEVPKAIATAKKAGIKTVMITGDHAITALAIARQIGIADKNSKVISGTELDSMTQAELNEIVEDVSVYARVSPEQKMNLLQAFDSRGHIVAMTGDGVNDAPALKRANIGVAMGITGTDVAKEASDMILADDNYSTIVGAVERGRTIYDNIRKFVKFELSSNFSEIALITVAALTKMPLPLIPLQILWINIITDTMPATTLAVDPPDKDIMSRGPRGKTESLFSRGMLPFMIANAAMMCILGIWLFLWGQQFGLAKARTIVFTAIVCFKLVYAFNCRSDYKSILQTKVFSNKYLIMAVFFSLMLQIFAVYNPYMQMVFGTAPLEMFDWMIIGLVAMTGTIISPRLFYKENNHSDAN